VDSSVGVQPSGCSRNHAKAWTPAAKAWTRAKAFSNPRTKDQAWQWAAEYLQSLGNPNLKVGRVNETVAAWEIQVVTESGSLDLASHR